MDGPNLPKEPKKLRDKVAVWAEMEELRAKYGGLSLGQGAPGHPPPTFLRDHMLQAIKDGHNQYCRTFGHPELITKVAEVYGKLLGRELDPYKEILITGGANGALGSFIVGLCDPGDEVVLFEPAYPAYYDHIELSGATIKAAPLRADSDGEWQFDPEELRSILNEKTKLFILNSPQNPTGKCFSRAEMETISKILDDFPNIVVISDEVYDFLTFDGLEHVRFATIGDNWKRTVTMYSGGKLLNATGWKVGWVIGPNKILHLGAVINNCTTFVSNTPGQVAFAHSLDEAYAKGPNGEPSFVEQTGTDFKEVRDYLFKEVKEMNLPWEPLPCHSGYFLMVNIDKCKDLIPKKYFESHDYAPADEFGRTINANRYYMPDGSIPMDLAFARWMGQEHGVAMMPNSLFYHDGCEHTI
mmetsp:Transcript_28387/g.42991  ORF Transcript_28387/g.42991 Transcript_28387/m.42991 type:complete len:413 (+) Transcript_28387:62-1300(+)